MKKLIALALLVVSVLPILVGCGESTTQVDSSKAVQIDSSNPGKKGAMESDAGLYK